MATRKPFILLAAIAVLAMVVVAGCGSDDSSSSSETTAATTETAASAGDFKTQFNDIKAQATALANDLVKAVQGVPGSSVDDIQTEFNALSDRAQSLADEAQSLEAPPEVKSAVEQLKSALQQAQKNLKTVAAAAADGNLSSAQSAALTLVADAALIKTAVDTISQQVK